MDSATVELMVNSFNDEEELMNFAATLGVQDSPAVRQRLLQIRIAHDTFVNEELDTILQNFGGPTTTTDIDLELAMEYVAEQDEIDGAVRALLYDDDNEETARICVEDGEWDPQTGTGEEPRAGPSNEPDQEQRGLQYTIIKKSERTYAKNAAVDRTYKIKIDEQYQGQRLIDIQRGLHDMFDDVLDQARGDLAGNDLGRVVIHHGGLQDPIVVPLQPLDNLEADTVMGTIEKVLNSKQNLSVDDSFEISVGSIDLPKGSGGPRRRITKLHVENNSLYRKTYYRHYTKRRPFVYGQSHRRSLGQT